MIDLQAKYWGVDFAPPVQGLQDVLMSSCLVQSVGFLLYRAVAMQGIE